jgi:hypothetical protein
MAFVLKRNLIRLTFAEGHPLEGLEVLTERVSTDTQLDIIDMAGDLFGLSDLNLDGLDEAKIKGLRQQIEPLLGLFAKSLVSWDLELESLIEGAPPEPVPATREGLGRLDFKVTMDLFTAWYRQLAPPAPSSELGKDSPSGVVFPEGSLPMVPLSPSLLSLPVPG